MVLRHLEFSNSAQEIKKRLGSQASAPATSDSVNIRRRPGEQARTLASDGSPAAWLAVTVFQDLFVRQH